MDSMCDSTEAVVDDEETLSRLWAILLPNHGRWLDSQEPDRSALLLRALLAHLRHPTPFKPLRRPIRMRPTASAPAPFRSFNQTRLRLRSSSHATRVYPHFDPSNAHHELRDLSITDGVPSLSQISSTTSHHSNETSSPRAVPAPSPRAGTPTCSDPVLNPLSHHSSFGPLGPCHPGAQPALLVRTLSENMGASTSPTLSPPKQMNSSYLAYQPMYTAQKNKPAAVPVAGGAPAPQIHAMLRQLSADVEVLLQDGSHGEALRQLQSVSSHLSSRLSCADHMHGVHHTSTRSSLALMHLAAVAEDTSPEERAIVEGEGKNGTASSSCNTMAPGAAVDATTDRAATQPGMYAMATGSDASMHPVNGCPPDRQQNLNRARRKVAGQTVSRRNGRFALQRSDSFAGVQHGLSESIRHSGSLPSSPPRNRCVLMNSERSALTNALSEGPHCHPELSEGTMSAGEMQLPLPGSSSLPTGCSGGTDESASACPDTTGGHAVVDVAAACGPPDASAEHMPQESTADGSSREAGGASGAHARAELSTIYNTLDGLRDSEAEPLYSPRDGCSRGFRYEAYGLRAGGDAGPPHEFLEHGGGLHDRERSEGEAGSEAGTDIGEDSVPLVHALVLRVLQQFAMSRA